MRRRISVLAIATLIIVATVALGTPLTAMAQLGPVCPGPMCNASLIDCGWEWWGSHGVYYEWCSDGYGYWYTGRWSS